MPATIHAKQCLSITSRGGLETAWKALAHSLIYLFCICFFLSEERVGKCIKNPFREKSHVWHSNMQLRNAKTVGFMFFPEP